MPESSKNTRNEAPTMSGFDGLHGWLGTEALSVRPSLSLYEWIKAVPYTEEGGQWHGLVPQIFVTAGPNSMCACMQAQSRRKPIREYREKKQLGTTGWPVLYECKKG